MVKFSNNTQRLAVSILLVLFIMPSALHAQRLGRYIDATKTEKVSEETSEQKAPTSERSKKTKRLDNYYENTRSERLHSSEPDRQRFHRTPRRHRHRVPSYRRHRYHRNYYPETVVIIDNRDEDHLEPETYSLPVETLTPEEIAYTNAQLDVYEEREGLFRLTTGFGSALGSSSGISSTHLGFGFTAPPSYGPNGRSIATWGLGYNFKGYEDDVSDLQSHRLFLEGRNTRLFNDFAHSWSVRLGLNALKSTQTSAGLLFGIHYDLHNLESIYAFHFGYDGTLYNIGSVDYNTSWESNLESYFRLYFGSIHVDLGGEMNIIDLEDGDYFHQAFVRAGVRF